jgi:serine/threonine protein phosphatase PrpC
MSGTKAGKPGRFELVSEDPPVVRDRETQEFHLWIRGPAESLAVEAAALEALAHVAAMPRVADVTKHFAHGVLSDLPPRQARRLRESARTLDGFSAERLLRELVVIATQVERAGYAFDPDLDDLWVSNGRLRFLRLRRVTRLARGRRFDVGPLLAVFAEAVLPEPMLHASTGALRFLLTYRRPPELAHATELQVSADDANQLLEGLSGSIPSPRASTPLPVRSLKRFPSFASAEGVACFTDVGLVRRVNEDAVGALTGGSGANRWTALVVCDGVSSSPRASEASKTAVHCVLETIHTLEGAMPDKDLLPMALTAANDQVLTLPRRRPTDQGPATTVVVALARAGRLTVCWAGDSRAYLCGPNAMHRLTRDHNWATEVVAQGHLTDDEARQHPHAHAITRFLGGRHEDGQPASFHPETHEVRAGEGWLVLATDGVWGLAPNERAFEAWIREGYRDDAAALAKRLVHRALLAGGDDNASVAVVALDDLLVGSKTP